MDPAAPNPLVPASADRTERDLALDLDVGLRIEGYRWVEWNHAALAGRPVDQEGRFVGHPGDLLAHLQVEVGEDVPLASHPYIHLPRFSLEPGPALRAAERAGLFGGSGVRLRCSAAGTWSVERDDLRLDDDCLPRLLSRAALRVSAERRERDTTGDDL